MEAGNRQFSLIQKLFAIVFCCIQRACVSITRRQSMFLTQAPPSSSSPPFLPPATRYYTELTHPPRLEAAAAPKEPLPRVPLGPSSAPEARRKREGERGVEVPDQSPDLRPAMVSAAVQTEDTLLERSQASTSFGAGGGDQESTQLPRSSSEGSPAPGTL